MFTGIVTDIGTIAAHDGTTLKIASHYDPASVALGASIACDGCCLTVTSVEEHGALEVPLLTSHDPQTVRQWIDSVCRLTDLTPTQLAKEARLAVTTVTRFVNEKDGAPENLGGSTLSKLAETASRLLLPQIGSGGVLFEVTVSNETASRTTLGNWQKGTRVNLERSLSFGSELGGHLMTGHIDGLARIVERTADGESARFVLEAPAEFAPFIAAKGSVALNGASLTVNEVEGARFGVNIIPYTLTHTTWGDREPGDLVNLEVDLLARYVERIAAGRLAAGRALSEQDR